MFDFFDKIESEGPQLVACVVLDSDRFAAYSSKKMFWYFVINKVD